MATDGFPDNVLEAFAEAYLRLGDAFKAAQAVFPHDTGRAVISAHPLANDPRVLSLIETMRQAEGAEAFLPTKADVARELYSIGIDAGVDAGQRINAFKTFADLMGYIPRDKNAVQTGNTTNNVMIVMERSEDDWQSGAIEQQKKLVDAARQY